MGMTVKELIDVLIECNQDEEVKISENDVFFAATEDKPCDLKNITGVTSGALYDLQEGVMVLLYKDKKVK